MISCRELSRLLFALLLLGLAGCSEQAKTPPVPILPTIRVQVESLTLREAPFQVEVAGTLQAAEQALISSRVSGQVIEVPVHPGSKVKKGDLLVQIRAAEINARVRQAETQLAQARRNLERETRLQQVGASTSVKVKTLGEQVQISEAAYLEASTMLDYTRIKAPFAGTLTHKLVEVGDLAAPGSPLLRLENSAALEVLLQLPEALAQGLTLGSPLSLTIPAAGLATTAQISEISPTVDPLSHSTQVKLTLTKNPLFRSGQYARVTLADEGAQTLLIPETALHQNGQMEQVFVVDQGVARMRLVRSGAGSGDRVEILSGLRAGDQVVTSAEGALQDGQPLEISTAGSTQ
jgi:membrane fusion protein, multidrug efflux system